MRWRAARAYNLNCIFGIQYESGENGRRDTEEEKETECLPSFQCNIIFRLSVCNREVRQTITDWHNVAVENLNKKKKKERKINGGKHSK